MHVVILKNENGFAHRDIELGEEWAKEKWQKYFIYLFCIVRVDSHGRCVRPEDRYKTNETDALRYFGTFFLLFVAHRFYVQRSFFRVKRHLW